QASMTPLEGPDPHFLQGRAESILLPLDPARPVMTPPRKTISLDEGLCNRCGVCLCRQKRGRGENVENLGKKRSDPNAWTVAVCFASSRPRWYSTACCDRGQRAASPFEALACAGWVGASEKALPRPA